MPSRIKVKVIPRMPVACVSAAALSAALSADLPTKDATGTHRQGDQQDAEGERGRPRGAEGGGGQALREGGGESREQPAGEAAQPAQHDDGEDAADIFASDRGLDRLDDDQAG